MCYDVSEQTRVKYFLDFKVGDTVKITHKANSHEGVVLEVVAKKAALILKEDVVLAATFFPGDKVRVTYPDYKSQRLTKISSAPMGTTTPLKADLKSAAFVTARIAALTLAKKNGQTNADEVQAELAAKGYTSGQLGNAAGAIFQGKNWKKVGAMKSTRPGNNRRAISIWQYIGA